MKKWTGTKTTSYLLASMMAATAMLGITTAAVSSADEVITGIRVAPAQGNTRVVFDLSGPTPYKLFTLDNPARVVVDFTDTNSLARGIGIPSEAAVTNVRSAVQSNNALRMVLDLKQPSGVKGFILPPEGESGHRLVVDIAPLGGNGVAASTPPGTAADSIGAAHIYGGNPFGSGPNASKKYITIGTAGKTPATSVPVENVPVENRAAVMQSTPSEADVAAIKALLEPAGRPATTATVKPAAVKPAATATTAPVTAPITPKVLAATANGSGLLDAKPAQPMAPVNVTPPPVVAVTPNASMAPKVSSASSAPMASAAPKASAVPKVVEKAQPVKVASKPVAASKPALPEPKVMPPAVKTASMTRPGNLRDVIVAIDAGHGGQDPGATGPSGIREKHITLAIARALREELSRHDGVKAELVRSGDYFIPLASRRDIARTKLKADLFVSIHADAALHRKARGASVFALSRNGATSSLAQMLADRENQADLVGGALEDKDKMVASVIADLALEGAMEHSMKVGGTVLKELSGTTPLHKRYIEKAGFAVLKSADFPSILVETGFISNPQEEKNLRNAGHQQKLARAITRGVMSYFTGNPPPGTYLAWKRDKGAMTIAYATPANSKSAASVADTRHTISRGDTLEKIANRYQVGLSDLRRANALSHNQTIKVGQVLQIPDT